MADAELSQMAIILHGEDRDIVPEIRDALKSKGVAIVIQSEVDGDTRDQALSGRGTAIMDLWIPVLIQENVKVNRALGGTGIEIRELVQRVIGSALAYPRTAMHPSMRIKLREAALSNLTRQDGMEERLISLSVPTSFKAS